MISGEKVLKRRPAFDLREVRSISPVIRSVSPPLSDERVGEVVTSSDDSESSVKGSNEAAAPVMLSGITENRNSFSKAA